ncbi:MULTISPECIES: hypothetical protein [unclassified Gordonia (in: high G+C Gram-positive bacteria)]|uniref:hypothetical protein n=1 Tax=unclassified Gordonia (in: high G+C Gram-positive bacteria) TaxID=2657482 RepID=UPI001F0F6D36|nr:hypothetical protein [Gordonia sp. ABSL49_1]MCH5641194.1 hypothetical protein [Gordonia sp. ABSL49_1]
MLSSCAHGRRGPGRRSGWPSTSPWRAARRRSGWSAGWQVAFLVAAAALGSAVTFVVGSSVIAYPLTLLWAFVAIIVNATGESTTVVVVAVVGIVAVIVAYLGSVKSRERRDEVSARR